MANFLIKTRDNQNIRFMIYNDAAPLTAVAFIRALPFKRTFLHARISGQEIWIDDAPKMDVMQENVSVFAEPGEIVIGPAQPTRNKIAGMMGIFYGEGKLVDGGNIFAKVFDEDMPLLISLGGAIWRHGAQELFFEILE